MQNWGSNSSVMASLSRGGQLLQLAPHALWPQPAVAGAAECVKQLLEVLFNPGGFAAAGEGQGDFSLGGLPVSRERNRTGSVQGEEVLKVGPSAFLPVGG